MSIEEFSQKLASADPAPGGGAAAALVLRLSAALVQMICQHTLGRPKYAAVEERIQAIAAEADRLNTWAGNLMDADASAYGEVSTALRRAKDDPRREQVLSDSCKVATRVPLDLMQSAGQILVLAEEIGRIGNRTLVADARTAALLARAVGQASSGNVEANLPFVKDPGWVQAARQEMRQALDALDSP